MTEAEYDLVHRPPDPASYVQLREEAGLSARSPGAAHAGLAGTWYGVHVRVRGRTVAMGRVIGDGGCFFQVVDVAVSPRHQGKGLGSLVMAALMEALHERAPASAQVTLLADGTAHEFYERCGFRRTAPASVGMLLQL